MSATMIRTELQQSLESTPTNPGAELSQPDMTDIMDMSDIPWDENSPGFANHADVGGTKPIQDREQGGGFSPNFNHPVHALTDHTDNEVRTKDPEILPSISIFGRPSGVASDDSANLIPTGDSTAAYIAGLAFESLVGEDTPMELEQHDVHYISTGPIHAHNAEGSPEVDLESACLPDAEDAPETGEGLEESVENLEHAIEIPEDEDQFVKKRTLRPQATSKRGFTSTWMDQDDSGNYDPKADRERPRAKRVRKNPPSQQRSKDPSEEVDEAEATESEEPIDESASDEYPELEKGLVALKFTTEEGIESLEKLLTGLAVQRAAQTRDRRRQRQREAGALQDQIQTTASLSIDFRNKPIARCCWSCANISGEDAAIVKDGYAECSLAIDPTQWPCLACLGDHEDCILITEPVRKLACEDCKRQRTACSFTSTRNHSGPCQQCKAADHQCIAGPAKDAIIPRLEYKAVLRGGFPVLNCDKEQTYTCNAVVKKRNGKKRRLPDCVECSELHADCSYEEGGGACIECKRTGRACTIPDKNSPIPSGSRLVQPPEPSAAPPKGGHVVDQNPLYDTEGRNHGPGGTLRTISTSYSHPIGFNCDDEKPRKACHFCVIPALRFVGFGRREVSVIDFDDNSGLVEVAGGHSADLLESSRLCTECTTARLSVIMCGTHAMAPIPDSKYAAVDHGWMHDSLLDGSLEPGGVDAFCSLCFSLATVRCNAGQVEEQEGCGLKLCDHCAAVLVGQHDGDLGSMLVQEENTSAENHGTAFRADAELLRGGGVLMRYLAWLSRQY